jgi:hypothetical protein
LIKGLQPTRWRAAKLIHINDVSSEVFNDGGSGEHSENPMKSKTRLIQLTIAAAIGGAGLLAGPSNWSSWQTASFTTQADARVGRPLTATSVAGVHRRVYRRAARRAYY